MVVGVNGEAKICGEGDEVGVVLYRRINLLADEEIGKE